MKRIAVALSGGVDSAVAAARLVDEGHNVIGLTARLLPPDWQGGHGCCDLDLARETCRCLGIEHHVVDVSSQFLEQVVEYFVRGYAEGLTPNPCLPCNRFIKFGLLLQAATRLGCDALATGHYAIRARRGERWGVRRGTDLDKEQSYMLLGLTQTQLSRALFPLGTSTKSDVVQEATRRGLPALLRESQDVCFVDGDYGPFLAARIHVEPGPILDTAGRTLGTHRGLIFYTVGQRRGLGIGAGQRLFVLAKDPARNALIVGRRAELCRREFEVLDVNWVSIDCVPPGRALSCLVMVRYRGALIPATVRMLEGGRCAVTAAPHDQAIAPGQGAAFYDEEGWLLGGGYIAGPW